MDPLIDLDLDEVGRHLEYLRTVIPIDRTLQILHEEGWEARMAERARMRALFRVLTQWSHVVGPPRRILFLKTDDGHFADHVWNSHGGKTYSFEMILKNGLGMPLSDNGWQMCGAI